MGGPSKRRAQIENKSPSSSGESSGQSVNRAIPPLDGNRDPEGAGNRRNPIDYSKPTDLKNISEALGLAGWVMARGVTPNESSPVSANTFFSRILVTYGFLPTRTAYAVSSNGPAIAMVKDFKHKRALTSASPLSSLLHHLSTDCHSPSPQPHSPSVSLEPIPYPIHISIIAPLQPSWFSIPIVNITSSTT